MPLLQLTSAGDGEAQEEEEEEEGAPQEAADERRLQKRVETTEYAPLVPRF